MPRLLALLAVLASSLLAADPVPAAFNRVREAGGIVEYTLKANGLSVLLLEDHSAPVLTVMVTYNVGSRNEVTGTTGATHLLEHLMFKGSKNFHAGNGQGFDTVMDSIGGINNATTSYDRTNYYENLPSRHLELALRLEADRMRGLLLREEDRQPEMTVVRNEFERGENDPQSALQKEIAATAFLAHPYHHPVIGWRSDIEKVSIARLREFYDTYYWPNNATLTLIGDFNSAHALALVERHFGPVPRAPHPIPQVYTEEPAQSGPRRVTVKRPGEVGVVSVGYKVPPATHADHAALEVLGVVLGDGKTSRLYRALIDTNLSIQADAAQDFVRDPTLFQVSAVLAPGSTHEQVEKVLLAELAKVHQEGVTPAEVSRAASKLLAALAFQRDGSFAIAGQLNEPIAVGDWTLYHSQLDAVKAVTAADVRRVAQAYLVEDHGTTGWFIPQAEAAPARASATAPAGAATAPARHAQYYRPPGETAPRAAARHAEDVPAATSAPAGGTLLAPRVHRRTIAGIDVATLRTSIKEVVTLRGALGGGDACNPPGNSALADLTAAMLDKGTVRRDKFAVAEVLEQTGATLAFNSGSHTVGLSAKFLRRDLTTVVGLLAEQLRTPRFDAGEFAKLRKQVAGGYRRALEDTDFRAENAFARAIFPEGHPNRPPAPEQYLADVEAATLEQVRAFHAAHYGPRAARLVLTGDIDDAALDAALAAAFSGWTGGSPIPAAATPAVRPTAARTERVSLPGKTSVSLVIGQPSGLKYSDTGYQSIHFATSVLGSGFFSARLLDIIRNREGLTYGIGASLGADTHADGSWSIRGTFAPDLLARGTESTLRELRRFCAEGVTAAELATFKVTLTGTYQVALSTTGGLASTLLNALQRGYGPEWLDEFPRRLEALTLDEVNAAIRTRLDPDRMVTVQAGTLP